jgi:carbon storage regulator
VQPERIIEMLVLARKVGQSIVIGESIELTVIEVRGEQVRIGIDAPRTISVHRKELLEQIRSENLQAAQQLKSDELPDVLKKIDDLPTAG